MKKIALLLSLLLTITTSQSNAEARKAQEWDIAEWINGQGVTVSS